MGNHTDCASPWGLWRWLQAETAPKRHPDWRLTHQWWSAKPCWISFFRKFFSERAPPPRLQILRSVLFRTKILRLDGIPAILASGADLGQIFPKKMTVPGMPWTREGVKMKGASVIDSTLSVDTLEFCADSVLRLHIHTFAQRDMFSLAPMQEVILLSKIKVLNLFYPCNSVMSFAHSILWNTSCQSFVWNSIELSLICRLKSKNLWVSFHEAICHCNVRWQFLPQSLFCFPTLLDSSSASSDQNLRWFRNFLVLGVFKNLSFHKNTWNISSISFSLNQQQSKEWFLKNY